MSNATSDELTAMRRDIALLFAMQAYDTLEPVEDPESWGGLEIQRDDGMRFVEGRRRVVEAARLASKGARLAAYRSYGWDELKD